MNDENWKPTALEQSLRDKNERIIIKAIQGFTGMWIILPIVLIVMKLLGLFD